jgi:glycosyltransferase involved in cell wall biosynthesis
VTPLQVEGAGLGGRFTFLGYRFDPDWCLAALDLFVLPSYREGMPVALLEAMAYGLPCVATRVRGSREVVRDGETGLLVPPRDAARLEGAIRSVLASPDRGEAMGARASREVAERYREEVLLERTEGLLEAVVERKLGGRKRFPPRTLPEETRR